MLDHLDASGRYALLKLATGELRIGVSARLAKVALAEAFGLDVDAVEEVWHGIGPPYLALFAWAEGRGAQPTADNVPVFRPFMLAHPLEANGPRQHYMRATLSPGGEGLPPVTALTTQDSAHMSTLAAADALIVRPPNAPAAPAGEAVRVLPLDF